MKPQTETILEKLASELEAFDEVANGQIVLEKIAFATQGLNILKQNTDYVKKTAATMPSALQGIGGTLTRALVAGIGLGLAGEAIGAGHEKVKKMLFDSKINSLANEVKKVSPELKQTNNEEIKRLLRAGYSLAPDLINNPTLAASFVGIGHSLGGKIDPNTMKLFAEAQNKARGSRSSMSDMLPNAGNVI